MSLIDEQRDELMKPEDTAKTAHEAKEIKDMQDDLRDIKMIFT